MGGKLPKNKAAVNGKNERKCSGIGYTRPMLNVSRFPLPGLCAALMLAACAGTPARHVAPYQPRSPLAASYGDWQYSPGDCTIRATTADFSLKTDGRLENGTILLRGVAGPVLSGPPMAEISELLAPVPTEGAGRTFNIVLAYDAPNAAHMLKPDTYLIVRYRPQGAAQAQEVSLATAGLALALTDLARFCGK